jgi:hypothetical protein
MTIFEIFATVCIVFSVFALVIFLKEFANNFKQRGHYAALKEEIFDSYSELTRLASPDDTLKVSTVVYILGELHSRRYINLEWVIKEQECKAKEVVKHDNPQL